MPTETKNSTAKASRGGSASSVARWLSGLSASTMPAKNAPTATNTPNSAEAPSATPRAIIAHVISMRQEWRDSDGSRMRSAYDSA
jgi:hypothetical protein